jgi:rhodanese-related sulfurtransferase
MQSGIRASKVLSLTASQLKKQLETQLLMDPFCSSVILIEVRNRLEIEQTGKIKGSVNIPLPTLVEEPQRLLSDIPKDKKVKALTINFCRHKCIVV